MTGGWVGSGLHVESGLDVAETYLSQFKSSPIKVPTNKL